jgi:hypothetical protein
MMKLFCLLSLVFCLLLTGCSEPEPPTAPAVDGSKFLLSAEPKDATNVIKAREEFKDQSDVVIIGRIGGSGNPWVDGRAAFSIVDMSLKSCDECGSHNCPKPWDFC